MREIQQLVKEMVIACDSFCSFPCVASSRRLGPTNLGAPPVATAIGFNTKNLICGLSAPHDCADRNGLLLTCGPAVSQGSSDGTTGRMSFDPQTLIRGGTHPSANEPTVWSDSQSEAMYPGHALRVGLGLRLFDRSVGGARLVDGVKKLGQGFIIFAMEPQS